MPFPIPTVVAEVIALVTLSALIGFFVARRIYGASFRIKSTMLEHELGRTQRRLRDENRRQRSAARDSDRMERLLKRARRAAA